MTFRELYVAFASFSPFVLQGCLKSFISLFLSQLQEDDSGITVDDENFSWIITALILSMPIGCIFGGNCSDRIGRKRTLQLTFIFFALGCLTIIFARNIYMLYAALVLGGFGSGMSFCSLIYVSEIATTRNRGFLSTFSQPNSALGILLCNVLIFFLQWRSCAVCILVTSIVFLIIVSFIPESPVWLILNHRTCQAQKILEGFRKSELKVKEEMDEIEKQRTEMGQRKKKSLMEKINVISRSWKPFLIVFGLSFFQQLCGFNILSSYGTQFFKHLDIPMDNNIASLIYFSVNILRSVVSPIASYHLSRRKQLMTSGALTGICWSVVWIYEMMFLKSTDKPYYWIVLVAICLYNMVCSFGITYLASVVAGELFVGEDRGLLISIYGVVHFMISATVVKLYVSFVHAYGIIWFIGVCAIGCFANVVYAFLVLPETGNKSLIEIQEQYFSKSVECHKPRIGDVEESRVVT